MKALQRLGIGLAFAGGFAERWSWRSRYLPLFKVRYIRIGDFRSFDQPRLRLVQDRYL